MNISIEVPWSIGIDLRIVKSNIEKLLVFSTLYLRRDIPEDLKCIQVVLSWSLSRVVAVRLG